VTDKNTEKFKSM